MAFGFPGGGIGTGEGVVDRGWLCEAFGGANRPAIGVFQAFRGRLSSGVEQLIRNQ